MESRRLDHNVDNFLNVEGLIIENKALTNHELINYIKQLGIKNFRGVFMRDNLPKKIFKKECGIVNLDDTFSSGNSLGLLLQ